MYSGLSNAFLYSAYRIEVEFTNQSIGKTLTGHGTAFFVFDDKKVHLVTNRHVVDLNYKELTGKYRDFQLSRVYVSGKTNDPTTGLPDIDQRMEIIVQKIKYSDEDNDVALFKETQSKLKPDGSKYSIDYPIPIGLLADEEKIKTGLQISDFVAFPGFPEWYDSKNQRPILRLGTIASDPRYNYSNNKDINGDCLAYEAFSYGGSSGSPVFALQRGLLKGDITTSGARELLLIGINAGHLKTGDGMQHSGISYLYKSSKILDLIRD